MASRKNKSGGNGASFVSGGESVVDQARSSAEEVVGKAREKASEAAGQAQDKARSQLSMGKDRVADSMESVAHALRSSTEQMQGQEAGFVGDYMNRAADKVSEFSYQLREKDVNELVRDAENFARREPVIFMAGAFALGLIAARFLKSSGHASQIEDDEYANNIGYSEDYEAGSIGGYDRDASSSFNQSGAAGMTGSGVLGDGPFKTGAVLPPDANDIE